MTELSIRPEEIRDALDSFVASYEPQAAASQDRVPVAEARLAGAARARPRTGRTVPCSRA